MRPKRPAGRRLLQLSLHHRGGVRRAPGPGPDAPRTCACGVLKQLGLRPPAGDADVIVAPAAGCCCCCCGCGCGGTLLASSDLMSELEAEGAGPPPSSACESRGLAGAACRVTHDVSGAHLQTGPVLCSAVHPARPSDHLS